MAIYEGARQRGGFELPWLRPSRGPRPGLPSSADRSGRPTPGSTTRRADRTGSATRTGTHTGARTSARAGARRASATRTGLRGQRRVATVLAGIVIAFSVAFVQLSQSVRVAATSYDIVRLEAEHDRLIALQQELTSDVERLRGEPAIRKEALDAGLGQLGGAVVLPAR